MLLNSLSLAIERIVRSAVELTRGGLPSLRDVLADRLAQCLAESGRGGSDAAQAQHVCWSIGVEGVRRMERRVFVRVEEHRSRLREVDELESGWAAGDGAWRRLRHV